MKTTGFFDQLYTNHYDAVLCFIKSRVSNYHTAEDLTQNTFMKIATNYGPTLGYDSAKHASIKTWILNYARNTIYDYYRTDKSSKYSFISDSVNCDGKEAFCNVEESNNITAKKEVRTLIRTSPELNEKDRKIALMYWVMGLKTKEVAEVLELPLGTVNVTMKRIKTKLTPQHCEV